MNRYLSFAVGGLLGDICLHLLPEIYSEKIDSSIIYDEGRQLRLGLSILTGILSFLAIEKLFDITQVRTDFTLLQTAINFRINDYLIEITKNNNLNHSFYSTRQMMVTIITILTNKKTVQNLLLDI